ncbi:MAG TPA: nuclear pore complex subunit, partial [Microscillaceae bacterium]|nr:nuclear pore complex subunit [Microscillaceae bacterium]
MENIFTKETASTPEIFCNLKQGIIKLKGVSLPEDSESFYQELFDFLEINQDELANKPINVSLMFLYLNTSSSAIISRLLQALEKIDN